MAGPTTSLLGSLLEARNAHRMAQQMAHQTARPEVLLEVPPVGLLIPTQAKHPGALPVALRAVPQAALLATPPAAYLVVRPAMRLMPALAPPLEMPLVVPRGKLLVEPPVMLPEELVVYLAEFHAEQSDAAVFLELRLAASPAVPPAVALLVCLHH